MPVLSIISSLVGFEQLLQRIEQLIRFGESSYAWIILDPVFAMFSFVEFSYDVPFFRESLIHVIFVCLCISN